MNDNVLYSGKIYVILIMLRVTPHSCSTSSLDDNGNAMQR